MHPHRRFPMMIISDSAAHFRHRGTPCALGGPGIVQPPLGMNASLSPLAPPRLPNHLLPGKSIVYTTSTRTMLCSRCANPACIWASANSHRDGQNAPTPPSKPVSTSGDDALDHDVWSHCNAPRVLLVLRPINVFSATLPGAPWQYGS